MTFVMCHPAQLKAKQIHYTWNHQLHKLHKSRLHVSIKCDYQTCVTFLHHVKLLPRIDATLLWRVLAKTGWWPCPKPTLPLQGPTQTVYDIHFNTRYKRMFGMMMKRRRYSAGNAGMTIKTSRIERQKVAGKKKEASYSNHKRKKTVLR